MDFASTSRSALSFLLESVFGETSGSGTPRSLRFTGEGLNFDLQKVASEEIRDDRQLSGTTAVGAQAAGDINFELSYGEYDPLLESVFQGTWDVYGTNGVGTTFEADFTATTITADAAPTGSSAFTGLALGQWFQLRAATGLNANKWFRVSKTTAPTSTVITLDPGTPAAVESDIAGCSVATSRLANGVTKTSFSIEKRFSDVTQFFMNTGMTPSSLALNFASGSLTTGTFNFMGAQSVRGAVTAMPGAPAASRAFNIQNGARGINHIWEGGGPLTSTRIKTLSMTLDNALRAQDALGTLGLVGVGTGTLALTGSASMYFRDGTMYDKFIDNEYNEWSFGTKDEAGNGYVITMPRVNLTNSRVVAGGKDQDVMAEFEFSAYADDTNPVAELRKTIFLDRLGVALAP